MNKEEALEQFLKSLRISLNYISLYSRSHRTFLNSVQQLRGELDNLFAFLEPVEIGFTPDSLIVAGQVYSKTNLHLELARLFHARKIKSIVFSRGISEEELELILDKVSLPVKEILKAGGLNSFLSKSEAPHFSQTELDYSQLLKDEGEETTDIWSYLLNSALDKEDNRKIEEFIETFETMLPRIKARNLVEDEKLGENLHRLLVYIREKDPDKFIRCSQELLLCLIRDRSICVDERIDKLKKLFQGLDAEDFAAALWEAISSEEYFDNAGLQLFARLVEQDKHEKIADSLVKRAAGRQDKIVDRRQIKRMKEIFSLPAAGPSYIPDIYRKAILQISEEHYFDQGFPFDRQMIQANYDRILLHLLTFEQEAGQRELVLKKIIASWERIAEQAQVQFFRVLAGFVARIPAEECGAAGELALRFRRFLEEGVWREDFPRELRELALSIKTSVLGPEEYLRRIFDSGQCAPLPVRQFFRLFPMKTDHFYALLEKRSGDFEFMSCVIESVKRLEAGDASAALKKVFSLSNELMKIDVIRAMGGLQSVDSAFLLSQIQQGNYLLKKEIMLLLKRDRQSLQQALKILLLMPNPWGKKNDLLAENLSIVEEIGCGEARPFLEQLSRKQFLFYSGPARKARRILEKMKNA